MLFGRLVPRLSVLRGIAQARPVRCVAPVRYFAASYVYLYKLDVCPFRSVDEYERVAGERLESLGEQIESYVQSVDGADAKLEVEYDDSVVSLSFPGKGDYIINRHSSSQQIWFSSPLSGPKRFDFDAQRGDWIDSRDKKTMLLPLLREEFKQLMDGEDIPLQ